MKKFEFWPLPTIPVNNLGFAGSVWVSLVLFDFVVYRSVVYQVVSCGEFRRLQFDFLFDAVLLQWVFVVCQWVSVCILVIAQYIPQFCPQTTHSTTEYPERVFFFTIK
jgi:hypothetical protein